MNAAVEKFQICMQMAKSIVARYRAEAPEGFDPKMSMAVIGIVGIGATLASTGVQMYSANKAGKDAKSAANQAAGMYQKTGQKADSLLAKYERLLSDPSRVLAMTMNANNLNWDDAKNATIRLNNFNQAELSRVLNKSIPGYQGAIGIALRNTRQWLRGQIPNDVSAAVQDRAAERATRFGLPAGSPAAEALTARDLGLTSLDLMGKGENSLQRWISTARSFLTPQLSSPMDFLFTPTQYTNTILAGADLASRRGNILLGAGNAATGAFLEGEAAGIKADQAQAQALAQGLESIGGIGMAYAGRKAPTTGTGGGGGFGSMLGAGTGGTANSLQAMIAALGGAGAGTGSPTTYQPYLNQ